MQYNTLEQSFQLNVDFYIWCFQQILMQIVSVHGFYLHLGIFLF